MSQGKPQIPAGQMSTGSSRGAVMGLVILIAVIAVDYVIAKTAEERGRSFGLFLFIGLVLSPLVSGLLLLVCGDRKQGG